MALTIKVLKKVGGRSDMIASRSWPQSRITIGRGEECTLVLEDPKKHVSRVHAELLDTDAGSFQLTVVSKVNPVFIGGKRHEPGSKVDLKSGDRFELGDYEIELLSPPPAPSAEPVVSPVEETTRPDNAMVQPQFAEPAAEAPGQAAGELVIDADIFGGEIPPVETGLFEEPAAAPAPAAAPPPPAPPAKPTVFEEATFIGKPPTPDAGPFGIPEPAAEKPALEANVFDEATYVGTAKAPASSLYDEATYVGGRPPAPSGAAPAAGPAPAGGGDAAAVQRMVSAFLEGAGLPAKEMRAAEAEEFLRQSGVIVRAAIEGAMALLAARATAKKELRAEDRTMVASKDNNPLKLMSDPQEAMSFLLDNKERADGFLNPVQAVSDAFADLRVHEVALIAGMRAALLGAIQRFDPKTLETELAKTAGGLGLNRKAKLWELFAGFHEKLARDAGDDFNKVFGREFMGTYMEQVKRLRGGR